MEVRVVICYPYWFRFWLRCEQHHEFNKEVLTKEIESLRGLEYSLREGNRIFFRKCKHPDRWFDPAFQNLIHRVNCCGTICNTTDIIILYKIQTNITI